MTRSSDHRSVSGRPIWVLVLCACVIAALTAISVSKIAVAQEVRKPKTLIELLFGPKKQAEEPPAPPKKKKAKKANPTSDIAKTPVVPKLDTASKILVFGDFFAKGIATGLEASFQMSPGIVIETRGNGSAGVVRDDLFDWTTVLPTYIAEVKPALIVVSLGANDRQQMKFNGLKEKFKSDLWVTEYERRVAAITKVASAEKIPLLWVGLPSFGSPSMTADAVTLNSIIQNGVSKSGGEFIDIWDGFVDEAGQFVVSGSDINGQQVRLRAADGIGYTEAGKRKVAFYIEKSARRLLGSAADAATITIGQDSLPDLISLPPMETTLTVRTPPVGLTDPELDGGSALLGDHRATFAIGGSQAVPVTKIKAPKGRIDDFSLPAK